jgi:hypothetical protein
MRKNPVASQYPFQGIFPSARDVDVQDGAVGALVGLETAGMGKLVGIVGLVRQAETRLQPNLSL